ncbi:MAG: carboxypeptidase-like regulatory domain-containing protein, partial [Bacteroidota bacterium]
MPGHFSLSVANDNLLTFADDDQGHILAYLLLESELKGTIEKPNFYFEDPEKHPEKDQLLALDYLMLTQGWRRFAWEKMEPTPSVAFQHPAETATVSGRVFNEMRQPVAAAKVAVLGTNESVMTDSMGYYQLENVVFTNGKVRVNISKDGVKRSFHLNDYEQGRQVQFSARTRSISLKKNITGLGKQSIRGKVVDEHGNALIAANVFIEGTSTGTTTNFDGFFELNDLPEGNFGFTASYLGYYSTTVPHRLKAGTVPFVEIELLEAKQGLAEVNVVEYRVPLIEQDNTTSGGHLTSQAIRALPTKNLTAMAATTAGLKQADDGNVVRIRGSRSNTTPLYVIDGIPIRQSQIDQQVFVQQARQERKRRLAKEGALEEEVAADQIGEQQVLWKERLVTQQYAMGFKQGYYRAREF